MTIRKKCNKSTLPSSHSHGLKTFVVHTLFLTQKVFFDTSFLSFLLRTLKLNDHFVQSSSLFKILCKHSMHIHTVNIFIYIYLLYLYIYLYRT